MTTPATPATNPATPPAANAAPDETNPTTGLGQSPEANVPATTSTNPGESPLIPLASASTTDGTSSATPPPPPAKPDPQPPQPTPPQPVPPVPGPTPPMIASTPSPSTSPVRTIRPIAGAAAPRKTNRPLAAAPGATAATTKPPKTPMLHWALFGGILVLALVLRLQDPLSSEVIGAEDPYRHMERTWDLMQGKDMGSYPPGLMILLYPFTLMGAETFYSVARFLPSLFGVGLVATMFLLCRRYTHPSGALVASFLVAVMPETIRRTNLLFPTALDVALVPVLFMLGLRAIEGSRRAMVGAGVLSVGLFILHPWVLALAAPPAVAFGLYVAWTRPQPAKVRLGITGGLFAGAALAVWMVFAGAAPSMVKDHAAPKLAQVFTSPGTLGMPAFVDLPEMLGLAALLLGIAGGAAVVLRRRTPFGMLALAWTLTLLPVILVDWFDMWYVPHRTVVYFALGLAMLAAVAVTELMHFARHSTAKAQMGITVGAIAMLGFLMVPAAIAMDPWYRVYSEDELEAWDALDDRGTAFVMAGSWQGRAGYRATTGNDALYNPGFFQDPVVRQYELQKNPDLVVLVDNYTLQAGLPTEFLEDWRQIGNWGTTEAYTRA